MQLDCHLVTHVNLSQFTDSCFERFILLGDRYFVDFVQNLLLRSPLGSCLLLKVEPVDVIVVLRRRVFLQELGSDPFLLFEKVKSLLKLE